MSVCFFNKDYEKKYNCEYEIKDNKIYVVVNYDIDKELETDSNGAVIFSADTKIIQRDILIIDSYNKKNYLLKNAYFAGNNYVLGTPDSKTSTRFISNCYFGHKDYEKLCNLMETPKIKKIRFYSNLVNELIGYPSFKEKESNDEHIVLLNRSPEEKVFEIGNNNIEYLKISDNWNSNFNFKTHDFVVNFDGFIELDFYRRVNYDEVYKYIIELMVYIQLFRPDRFILNKMRVFVNDVFYVFNYSFKEFNFSDNVVNNSVADDFGSFLSNCYKIMPYRKGKNEIRNLSYIIFDYTRNIEDMFLMLYRTIECYYKRQDIQNIKNTFISYSIKNNYKKCNEFSNEQIVKISQEIISLRNHYVHFGYYLKNNKLKIKFKKEKQIQQVKDYTVVNINFEWIYIRTKILFDIVIDIIFSRILGYNDYNYTKKI